jgi:hypothetical protein
VRVEARVVLERLPEAVAVIVAALGR